MTKKVMIFNAPPFAGKDYAVEFLKQEYDCNHVMFKRKLYQLLKVIYNLSDEQLESAMMRHNKEYKSILFNGISPRDALIKISEEVIKPNFGKDYFTKELVYDLDENKPNVASDGGFPEEIISLAENIGGENIFILRIQRDGCSFVGDSRTYISNEIIGQYRIRYVDIKNDEDYLLKVNKYFNIFFDCGVRKNEI